MDLTPTRRGRCAGLDGWRAQYRALEMTAEDAAALIRDGDTLALPGHASWPRAFDDALSRRLRAEGGHVTLRFMMAPPDTALLSPALSAHVEAHSSFFNAERALAEQGNVTFDPINLSGTPRWLMDRPPRVTVVTCAPPDEDGWMSRSLWAATVTREAIDESELLLVEINDQLPPIASSGERHTRLHVSEADGILRGSAPPLESRSAPADELDRRIAGFIADLVPDGACVQFGLGGLANAVGECLAYAGKRDLGVQTEVVSGCIVELMRRGVVNNSRKQTCRGLTVGANFVGGPELWDFIRDNPLFCQKEIDWVNDPRSIARNDHVVSINNAMEIDLTGQVNAESVGPRQYSGTGGQLDWVLGSQWSRGGKSILALRSAYRDRAGVLHSKITPQLAPGSIVTTPRSCVEYVVTEYGVADLRSRSVRERARALIAIAHPDFREELRRAWERTAP